MFFATKIYVMKKFYYTLLLSFIATTFFAQGIAVQGIARDNTSSAIVNTTLTYTFSITKSDNTVQYSETQAIKTDNYGVFSHIVSTGNPGNTSFNSVDFSLENLKIKVSVNFNSNDIIVYDQELQYVPYAKYAENGVPTGTVVAFIGSVAPRGWLLCDGTTIPAINTALRALLGTSKTPDLKGIFLRGTGTRYTGKSGPTLNRIQFDTFKEHSHAAGTYETDTKGDHDHADGIWNQISKRAEDNGGSPEGTNFSNTGGNEPNIIEVKPMKSNGDHAHDVKGTSGASGGTETRPINYGVNYIIKL